MKYFLMTTLLLACQFMQAQESAEPDEGAATFTRSYTLHQLSEDDFESWQDMQEGRTLFVFNKGADKHIEWIFDNTKNKLYKTSDVKRDSTDNGDLYQAFEAITEKGIEVKFFLFDSGILLLYFTESDEAIRFINPDYLKD
ncbi:MAG: hypothetical protein ACQES1_11625 [Bacteroidota bacterium]